MPKIQIYPHLSILIFRFGWVQYEQRNMSNINIFIWPSTLGRSTIYDGFRWTSGRMKKNERTNEHNKLGNKTKRPNDHQNERRTLESTQRNDNGQMGNETKNLDEKTGYTVHARFVHQKYLTWSSELKMQPLGFFSCVNRVWLSKKPDLNKHSPFVCCCCCCCMLSIFRLECLCFICDFVEPEFRQHWMTKIRIESQDELNTIHNYRRSIWNLHKV